MKTTVRQQSNRPGTARPAAATATPSVNVPAPFGPEQIRSRAYQIYLRRAANGVEGDAVSDWLQAERELRSTSLAKGGR